MDESVLSLSLGSFCDWNEAVQIRRKSEVEERA